MTNPTDGCDDGRVAEVAKGLTKGGRRGLMRINAEWTDEGAPGPSRVDAYTLGWGRDAKHGLIERKVTGYGTRGAFWAYRLTAAGRRVAAILATERGA